MNKPENIQPMTEERYQELICYTAMGGATVILDQYADHPETVKRDIIRDYEDMMTEITRLRDELNNAAIWKERATALYDLIVGADLMHYAEPSPIDSVSYVDVYERANDTLTAMREALKADIARMDVKS